MWGQIHFVQSSCNQRKDLGDSGYRSPRSAAGSTSVSGVCKPHHLHPSLPLKGEPELSADSLNWPWVPSWWSESQSQSRTHSGSTRVMRGIQHSQPVSPRCLLMETHQEPLGATRRQLPIASASMLPSTCLDPLAGPGISDLGTLEPDVALNNHPE